MANERSSGQASGWPDLGNRALDLLEASGRTTRAEVPELGQHVPAVFRRFDARFGGLDIGAAPGQGVVSVAYACAALGESVSGARVPCIWAGHDEGWWLDTHGLVHWQDRIEMPGSLCLGRATIAVERLVRSSRRWGWTRFDVAGRRGEQIAALFEAVPDPQASDEHERWWFGLHFDLVERLDFDARCRALWDEEEDLSDPPRPVVEIHARTGAVETHISRRVIAELGPIHARIRGGAWRALDDLWV